jgi:hypothetical protein
MRTLSRCWRCAVGALTMLLVLGAGSSAEAQGTPAVDAPLFASLFDTPPVTGARHAPPGRLVLRDLDLPWVEAVPALPAPQAPRPSRGPVLPALYAGFSVLQALDAHSTLRAIDAGHREANPVMAPFASRPGALIAVKGVTAAGTVYLAHRIGRRHRVASTALMIALNAAYGAVVAKNYAKAREGAGGVALR